MRLFFRHELETDVNNVMKKKSKYSVFKKLLFKTMIVFNTFFRSGFIQPVRGDSGQCLKQHHHRNANQSSPAAALTKNKRKIKTYNAFW